jgi:tRNA(Arg) A34 adenosine deaminase TadA
MLPALLRIALPEWLAGWEHPGTVPLLADRMSLVLDLAMRNVTEGTGGPFAAAVFELDTGRLVAAGVLALGLADAALGTYDLGSPELPTMQLVSSSQMCAMCLGAVVWSGVAEVAWSTTTGDVVATVGFDEGPTPPDYTAALDHRGIHVIPGLMREQGLAVLRRYVAEGGAVYNAHH